jgi:hypothetical protein
MGRHTRSKVNVIKRNSMDMCRRHRADLDFCSARSARWHPSVLTLSAQKTADFRQDLGRRAPRVIYCASVSPNVRCVSTIVRPTPASVSDNLRRKRCSIARRAVHHCAPLQLKQNSGAGSSHRGAATRDRGDSRNGLSLRSRSVRALYPQRRNDAKVPPIWRCRTCGFHCLSSARRA